MLTRQEFESLRRSKAKEMAGDHALQAKALDVLAAGIPHSWISQTSWFGEPILQLPQDLFALQEIIFATRPEFIIEIGVAWAGSLLFYATLMSALGGKGIIGVDVFIPPDLKERLYGHKPISGTITLLEASSIDESTVEKIGKITGGSGKVLIHLDSNHTHEHVLRELNLYAPLVGEGYYLLCGDTHVERLPKGAHGAKPYDVGNSPGTAVAAFLKTPEGRKFEVDLQFEDKYLFSLNPGGYLRRVSK